MCHLRAPSRGAYMHVGAAHAAPTQYANNVFDSAERFGQVHCGKPNASPQFDYRPKNNIEHCNGKLEDVNKNHTAARHPDSK